jgi:hypothetical protein
MWKLIFLSLLLPLSLKAQKQDRLANNKYIENDSIQAKLDLVKELFGNNQKNDSASALAILNDCKDRNFSCKYELFKFYYKTNPETAYCVISDLALSTQIKDHYDSILVLHARLIAADMNERGIGIQVDLKQSLVWYLFYFELQHVLKNRDTENMVEELYRLAKLLDKKQQNTAFKDAEQILGKEPVFKRAYLDKEPTYFYNQERIKNIQNIKKIFENYIKQEESTDSPDNKNLMISSLKSLTNVSNPDDLELLINVWMYYDPTDFPSRELVCDVLKKNKRESIKAIKTRIKQKKKWETDEVAPYSDLHGLLNDLNN